MELARVVCRPALPQDTHAILELTKRIWNGGDYIPLVWQDWLADEHGWLAIAELGGHIVGMGKLTQLTQRDWWLEGLRVHPDFERRGIATHIQEYLLSIWQKIGNGAIRLATSSQRVAVHRLCQRSGFQKVAEISMYEAVNPRSLDGINEPIISNNFIPVDETDLEDAWRIVINNPLQTLGVNFVDLGWQWLPISKELLNGFVQKENIYWWSDQQGLLILGEDIDEDSGEKYALIRWVACDAKDLTTFLSEIRTFTAILGYPKGGWIAPIHPAISQALIGAGFENVWDFSLYLFEKWYNPASK